VVQLRGLLLTRSHIARLLFVGKNVVFVQQTTTKEDMMERIRRACAAIPRDTLLSTVRNFQRRLNLCLEANGRNFEQLLHG